MKLGFGPYTDWDYGEVLAKDPGYAEFPEEEEEGRMGNLETIYIQWAMRMAIETLSGFTDNAAIVVGKMAPNSRWKWSSGSMKKSDLKQRCVGS